MSKTRFVASMSVVVMATALGDATGASVAAGPDTTVPPADADATFASVPNADDITVGVSIWGHVSPWLDSFGERMEVLGEETGVEVQVLFADGTAQGQDEQVNALIAQDPDAIVLVSLDAEASVATYARIRQAGIAPIAGILPPTDPALEFIEAYRGPDDFEHGRLGAQALAAALEGQSGGVAMVRGAPGGTDNLNRAEGFTEELAAIAPDLEIVADEDSDWADQAKIYDVVSSILSRHPDIIGIFTQADTLAAAASKAVEDAGLTDQVAIVGVGGSCEGFDLVEAGSIVSTSLQDPWIGADSVFEVAVDIANDEEVEQIGYMDLPVITQENVADYECHW